MKNQFRVFFTLTLISSFAVAAGGMSDGGGNSVVCRSDDKITSAKLLDLYEAEALLGLEILQPAPGLSFLDIAKNAAKNIDAGGGGNDQTAIQTIRDGQGRIIERSVLINPAVRYPWTESSVERIAKKMRLLPPGTALKPIDDSNNIILPRNCKIEQTAVYRDKTHEIFVDGDIWNHLDDTNKAALLVHEALYHQLRQEGDSTSERTRQVVGNVFAGMKLQDVLSGIPNDVMVCFTDEESPKYRFAVYESSPGVNTYQFLTFDGRTMLTKASVKMNKELPPEYAGSTLVQNLDSLLDGNLAVRLDLTRKGSGIELAVGLENATPTTCTLRHFRINDDGSTRSW